MIQTLIRAISVRQTKTAKSTTFQLHYSGGVRQVTAGANEDIDESAVQRCIDGPLVVIPRHE